MNAPTRAGPIEPLLHPKEVAKLLYVSLSWLAKSRLSGTGPRFVKIGRAVRYPESAVREFIRDSGRFFQTRTVAWARARISKEGYEDGYALVLRN
jgi:predicted DNA-binding transcriptional regulator AlpA